MEISIPIKHCPERNQTFDVTSTGCPQDHQEEELVSDRERLGPVTVPWVSPGMKAWTQGWVEGQCWEHKENSWNYPESGCKRKDSVQSRESKLFCQSFQGISGAGQRESLSVELTTISHAVAEGYQSLTDTKKSIRTCGYNICQNTPIKT